MSSDNVLLICADLDLAAEAVQSAWLIV